MTITVRQHKHGGFVLVEGRRRLTMARYRDESSARAARVAYMKQGKGTTNERNDDAAA